MIESRSTFMDIRDYYQQVRKKLRGVVGHIVGAPAFSVVVFQMGKVGSTTVHKSLIQTYKKLHQPVDVFHSHILTGFDEAEEIIRRERHNPEPSLGAIAYGKRLKKLIDETSDKQWKIISLVRDPVARNVATFFENLQEFVPDWDRYDKNDPMLMNKLQMAFLEVQTIHSEPVRWFDEQLLPICGVDVFAEIFPHKIGYKIYNPNPRIPVLIIRLEDLSRVGGSAIHEFLGLNNFELVNTNIGEKKSYAEIYRHFKQQPLPESYIKEIYSTKYARTFYTKAEIATYSVKWGPND